MKGLLFFVTSLLGILGRGKASVYNNEITNSEDEIAHDRAGFNVNTIVDGILVATRTAIAAAGDDVVPLDDFETDVKIPLKIATLNGHLKLVNGTLKSLSSIKRLGDAQFIPRLDKREFDVQATLGLETAVAKYYYWLRILGTHPNGNVTADVGENAIEITFAASFDRRGCHLQLNELKMSKLDNINVTLTGLYPFDNLSSKLATHMADGMKTEIGNTIIATLRYHIESELHKVPCPEN